MKGLNDNQEKETSTCMLQIGLNHTGAFGKKNREAAIRKDLKGQK